jgi:hypothetical protein
VTDDQQPETTQPKLEWVKPEFQRIDVGAAEFGDSNTGDAGGSFS